MIDIKEIFKSDLDPNNQAWWSKDKIDKINYNFYQLSNGGMPGPQGQIGPDGDFGPIGATGAQGPQGFDGAQGPIGAAAESDWVYYEHTATTPGYLFPKPFDVLGIQYTPSSLKIGIDGNTIDYNNAALYNEYVVRSNVNSTATPESIKINLRLQHDGKVADFILTENGELKVGKVVSGDPGFKLIHGAKTSAIKTGVNEAHSVDEGGTVINKPATTVGSTNETKSNDSFSYNYNAQTNYILSADDSTGNVSWKKKTDVFPSFPIGSIISIRESDFLNTNNFYLNETINHPSGVLSIRWGRGKEGSQYEGWYLCNGKTWFASGQGSYLVPNLNSFNYQIASNGTGQYLVANGGNNDPIMIGGYNISVEATQNNGVYTVGFTNTWEGNDTSSLPNTMGTDGISAAYVTRMVHIIYLEKNMYVWQDSGLLPATPQSPNQNTQ